ncbi:aspartyl-phosphate phosphatase Spo0E family protein [Sporanaerobium hydrogeniformans]|nr:aspartyl-phosphate phosphatase Spo0E family protein [Sporanaerobium hydrogeniformans]
MRHQLFQEIEKQRDELNELLQSPKGKQYDVIEQSQKLDQLILEYIKQL